MVLLTTLNKIHFFKTSSTMQQIIQNTTKSCLKMRISKNVQQLGTDCLKVLIFSQIQRGHLVFALAKIFFAKILLKLRSFNKYLQQCQKKGKYRQVFKLFATHFKKSTQVNDDLSSTDIISSKQRVFNNDAVSLAFYSFMHNDKKWSNILYKSCSKSTASF